MTNFAVYGFGLDKVCEWALLPEALADAYLAGDDASLAGLAPRLIWDSEQFTAAPGGFVVDDATFYILKKEPDLTQVEMLSVCFVPFDGRAVITCKQLGLALHASISEAASTVTASIDGQKPSRLAINGADKVGACRALAAFLISALRPVLPNLTMCAVRYEDADAFVEEA